MHLKIIAVGSYKEKYWKDAEAEYIKRLTPYAKIEIIELKEESFRSESERAQVQEKEADAIRKHIAPGEVPLLLEEGGTEYDSPAFSAFLARETAQGAHLVFILGGPLGISASLRAQGYKRISLSQLTFPHQMARVVLLEQLYRAITIQKGKKYHY